MGEAKLYALDIETTGLSPHRDRITQIAVWSPDEQHVFTSIYDFCDWVPKDALFFGHNLKFDIKFLIAHGYNFDTAKWVQDTILMAHVCTQKVPQEYLEWYEAKRRELNKDRKVLHREAGGLSLKTLAPYFLKVEPFWEPESHDDAEYALKDAEYTYRLYYSLKQIMPLGEYSFYENKILPWTKMLLGAELTGLKLDLEALNKMEAELTKREVELKQELDVQWVDAHREYHELQRQKITADYIEAAERQIVKKGLNMMDSLFAKDKRKSIVDRYMQLRDGAVMKLDKQISYDSPKQMLWLLRDYMGLDVTNFQGKETTGKAILERLSQEGDGRPDIAKYLEWRKTQKILTAFLPSYKELAHNGSIYPSFNPTGTRTGRLSSADPNLQQVPPALRKLFVPRSGRKFIGYDAAAIEAKLIAWYSEDHTLFELISTGASLHDYNARVFFGLECDLGDVKIQYPRERAAAKQVGFALFYGAGPNRIKETLTQHGFVITETEAKRIYKNVKEAYPEAFAFHREITEQFEAGETVYNALGRPIKIQAWENPYMQGFNSLVQSTGSDINLHGAYRAQERWREAGLDAQVVSFVHDFVMAEVADKDVELANSILVNELTNFKLETRHGVIPLTVDGGVSDRWNK